MNRRSFPRVLALLAVTLAACGPVYVPPDLAPSQLAVVQGGEVRTGGYTAITHITHVDGASTEAGQYVTKTAVRPGEHTITIVYVASGGIGGVRGAPIKVTFDAKPGRIYQVHGAEVARPSFWGSGGRWTLWVEDTQTGEIVADCRRVSLRCR